MYRDSTRNPTSPDVIVCVKPSLDATIAEDKTQTIGSQEIFAMVDPNAPVGFDAHLNEVFASYVQIFSPWRKSHVLVRANDLDIAFICLDDLDIVYLDHVSTRYLMKGLVMCIGNEVQAVHHKVLVGDIVG